MRRALVLLAILGTACTGRTSARSAVPSSPVVSIATPSRPTATPTAVAAPVPPKPPSPFPGYLLIADRGNDRMLLVDGKKRILWRYPAPTQTPTMPFSFDDDTFFTPSHTAVISNQEEQHTIQVISFPGRRILWSYGHVGVTGSGPGYLHTPDDAYMLPNGTVTVADISNCRILFIGPHHRITRQIGTTGACRHAPPGYLGLPNGDTPMPDGGTLVTEITGSWVDAIGPDGKLRWAVQAPVSYPSDAQWLGHGKILLTDYHSPGSVVEMTWSGHVVWRYGPASGPGELSFPSLALMLPNGLVAVNDDARHRVVVIDPKTDRIVWQYGHTDAGGSSPGYLDRPDGMDFLPYGVAIQVPRVRAYLVGRLGKASGSG